jgi:hypothetical protein
MTDAIVQIVSGAVQVSPPGTTLLEDALAQIDTRSAESRADPTFPADIHHIMAYGQSLSVGTQSTPSISTAQRFDNLTFDGGVRAIADGGSPATRTALVPLVEADAADVSGGPAGETPLSGATEMIKELILSENSIPYTSQSYQLLGSAPGVPATPIEDLAPGNVSYDNLVTGDFTAGASLAAAAGKTYKCLDVIWMQGESNVSNTAADYETQLLALRASLDTDVKALTNQTEDVIFFLYGGQEMNIAKAMHAASVANSNMIIAAPMYFIEHHVGDVHLTALGEKIFGAYCGRAIKRTRIDGEPWKPVQPKAHFRQGKIVEIRFDVPVTPLALDTLSYAAQTSMGFRLYQADGTTAMTISSVTVTQPDTVRIVASATIPANAVLRYGMDDPTTHNAVFGGNLRDSDDTVFGGGGLNQTLPNWCVCFERVLS